MNAIWQHLAGFPSPLCQLLLPNCHAVGQVSSSGKVHVGTERCFQSEVLGLEVRRREGLYRWVSKPCLFSFWKASSWLEVPTHVSAAVYSVVYRSTVYLRVLAHTFICVQVVFAPCSSDASWGILPPTLHIHTSLASLTSPSNCL